VDLGHDPIYGFVNMSEASPRAVVMPFLIKDELGADVALLGIFGSVFSVGFIVGAILLGNLNACVGAGGSG